jgi:hypothetical protein
MYQTHLDEAVGLIEHAVYRALDVGMTEQHIRDEVEAALESAAEQ